MTGAGGEGACRSCRTSKRVVRTSAQPVPWDQRHCGDPSANDPYRLVLKNRVSPLASPPTLDELRRLAPSLQSLTAAHGRLGLQVFGSVVRGVARPGSDLDLLVEFPASPSFEQVLDLKLALEDLPSA